MDLDVQIPRIYRFFLLKSFEAILLSKSEIYRLKKGGNQNPIICVSCNSYQDNHALNHKYAINFSVDFNVF